MLQPECHGGGGNELALLGDVSANLRRFVPDICRIFRELCRTYGDFGRFRADLPPGPLPAFGR